MTAAKPLRVLHLVPRFNHGGVARVISDLIAGSTDVVAHMASDGGDWMEQLDLMNVKTFALPLVPSNLMSVIRGSRMLRRIVKDNAIDVVHGHHRFASLVSRLAVRGTDAVCVASVHDLASGNRAITRFALGPSIMVYSDAVGAHLRNHFGIASERIASIPMGMTSNRDVPPESITALKSDLRCPPSAAVVLFAGRLDWEKAPDLFVNAAAEIADAKPEVRFWIVGDGEMRSALEARVRELDIADRVTFTGWRDDIDVVLEAADVLVAPSRREGFGRSVLEAMSHGKSVVATKTGGLAELIDDGRNGLFARDDASSLADAVIRVLNDRALSVALGRGALETAKRYGREAMIRETERTYHRARGEAS